MAKASPSIIKNNAKTLVEMIDSKDKSEIDKFVSLYFAKIEDTEKLLRLAGYVSSAKAKAKANRTYRTQLNVKVWYGVLYGFLGLEDEKPTKRAATKRVKTKTRSDLSKTLFG